MIYYKPNELLYIDIKTRWWEMAMYKTPSSNLIEIFNNLVTEKYNKLLGKIINKPSFVDYIYMINNDNLRNVIK